VYDRLDEEDSKHSFFDFISCDKKQIFIGDIINMYRHFAKKYPNDVNYWNTLADKWDEIRTMELNESVKGIE
jgi:hypothetical protein